MTRYSGVCVCVCVCVCTVYKRALLPFHLLSEMAKQFFPTVPLSFPLLFCCQAVVMSRVTRVTSIYIEPLEERNGCTFLMKIQFVLHTEQISPLQETRIG